MPAQAHTDGLEQGAESLFCSGHQKAFDELFFFHALPPPT
jgi:hypothetical protein